MARYWWGGLKPATLTASAADETMTAAAVTVAVNNPPSHVLWGGATWQQEVWGHYDTTPELHEAAAIIGMAFGRAKLIPVDVDPLTLELGTEPTKDPVALALTARLFGGPTGRSQAQKQIGQHLTGPGECWVLATDLMPDVDDQTWEVIAVTEVTKAGNTIRIQQLDGTMRDLQETELLFRLFNPHPRRRWEADSASRALLPVFRELAGLSAQILASIKSRLATGGLLLIPDSIAPPFTTNEAGEQVPFGAQGWMQMLAQAMTTAIANPEDPSSLVPIVMTIPDDVVKLLPDGPMKFVQDVMTDVQPLRDAAQKRIAIGMDMPPEALLGMGDINHWGQWFIDESWVKGALTSMLQMPADAFTTHYLRPGMRLAGRDPKLFAYRFDVDHMIADANEDNAQKAYDAGVLSEEAYLRALHFDPVKDAAPQDQRERKLLEQMIARGNPQTVQELADMIRVLYPNFKLDPLPVAPGQPAVPLLTPNSAPPPKAIEAPAASTTDTQQPPNHNSAPLAPAGQ